MEISPSQPEARSLKPEASSKASPGRLFVVLRADLDPGLMLAQTLHVARKFTRLFPQIPVRDDENAIVLAVKDEAELAELLQKGELLGPATAFHEPDLPGSPELDLQRGGGLGGSLTAIALGGDLPQDPPSCSEPGSSVARLVSQLPCALRWLRDVTFVRAA